jgi:hypothetical protein
VDLVAVLSGISGAVLVWSALKNKNPIKAVQLALSGGDPNTAPAFAAVMDPASSPAGWTGQGEANTPLTGPNGPLSEYGQYDPNAPGLGGMPTI